MNLSSDEIMETIQRFKNATLTLIKWLLCATLSGCLIGFVGSCFHLLLGLVTDFRFENPNILFLLPLGGLVIIFLYRIMGEADNKGTNLVITAIQSNEEVPIKMAPLIIISTAITHLLGGSAGREGAALQVGGSLGNFLAKAFKFDDKDTRIMIMCGMSACFSALFGTPIAAAIFSMEVISVGIMYYAALVPCVISALIAQKIASYLGIAPTAFTVDKICKLDMLNGTKFVIMAICFALASILLCLCLHNAANLYKKYLKSQYLRVFVAALLVIALRYIFGSTDYLGAGSNIISASFVNSCAWYVFILKIIFTAITLGGGFKGGEIVPTLFVGATLGSFLASVFGLPVGLCAACGMVAVFCGVTNCPITSILLSIEMFGASSIKYCVLCIALSYLLSGYYSLYSTQKIMYSKYRTEFINKATH